MSVVNRLLLLAVLLLPPGLQAAGRLPVEYYTRLPHIENVVISPSGRDLAYFRNTGALTELVVRTNGNGQITVVLKADNTRNYFNWFRWANDERLLVSESRFGREFGQKLLLTQLIGVNRDGALRVVLTKPYGRRALLEWLATRQDDVIDMLPHDREHILIAADYDKIQYPSVYRINVYKRWRERIVPYREPIRDWITDRQGRVRIGFGVDKTNLSVITREADGADWRTLWHYDMNAQTGPTPIGFGNDPNTLYLRADHNGKDAVFKADLRTRPPRLTLLKASATRDVGASLITLSHKVAGMYFAGAQDKHLFWDPELTRLQDRIDAARPQFSNFIISISTNGEHFVVASARANTPIEYLLAHRNEESPELLGSSYPQLQHISVSSKTAISYRASDGMEIQGFLTTPRGVKPIQLPTIVLPHGGPEQHDSGSFDVWAEFLADRGYAVLQPNFRGSTGYGSAFHRAGFNQWGLRMQDDISDGIKWLVAQGVADPTRVCIVGASYGGIWRSWAPSKPPSFSNAR